MFHIAWMVLCLGLGLSLASFLFSFFPVAGWWAVLTFLICAIPGGVLTWYLYWGGRWLATPLSNYLFKNPVAPKKRLIDGLTVRASYSLVVLTLMALPFYAFLTADFSHLPNTDPAVPLQYKMLIALHTYSGQVFLAALGLWIFITH